VLSGNCDYGGKKNLKSIYIPDEFHQQLRSLCRLRGKRVIYNFAFSGDKGSDRGLTKRRNRHLRYLIIEAAWIAVRKEPVLLYKYKNEVQRSVKFGNCLFITT